VSRYDAGSNTYLCPGEQRLEPRYHSVVKGHALVNYCNHEACRTCPLRPRCTPNSYRRISRWANEAVLDRMAERLAARRSEREPQKLALPVTQPG